MKPNELKAFNDWMNAHIDVILCLFTACAAASMLSGGLYDSYTDNQPLMVATMFVWPWPLPLVVLGSNKAVLTLRTREERKEIKAASLKSKLADMERELLDA